nr:MAG TPA: hypothetical protein [Caudoviricetes sp.]
MRKRFEAIFTLSHIAFKSILAYNAKHGNRKETSCR